MLQVMSGLRPMRALRATVVALTVLVLVPAWMARTVYVYACPVETSCCEGAKAKKVKAKPRTPEPRVHRVCCNADKIELATRTTSTLHDEPALPARDELALALVIAPPAAPVEAAHAVVPRATGPPTYLRTLSLLL
jgi:hypothetical protein